MKYVILVKMKNGDGYVGEPGTNKLKVFDSRDEAYEFMHEETKELGKLHYVATLEAYFDLGGTYEVGENVSTGTQYTSSGDRGA